LDIARIFELAHSGCDAWTVAEFFSRASGQLPSNAKVEDAVIGEIVRGRVLKAKC
jgi:hypothetical protein